MNTVERPFETWRAVIDAPPGKGLPSMLEYAHHIEHVLEHHGSGEPSVRLSPTDDTFLRSFNGARATGNSDASRGVRDRK